jgi:16S rRNA (guanine(966)-N(2))-methyltransferase RsmD
MQILAGLYRGRRLLSPPRGSDTRPITGLVKKSLFGMIGPRLPGATVLDLYCGTGTLGLEALSQGAGKCFFAERDKRVLARLSQNIQTLGVADRCVIWAGDIASGLANRLDQLDLRADVAFIDPPFEVARQWSWEEVGRTIFAPVARRLSSAGVVALRLPRRVQAPHEIGPLRTWKSRDYGDMSLVLLVGSEEGS